MPFKNKDQYRAYQRAYHRRYKKIRRGERSSLDNLKGDLTEFEPHGDIAQVEHDYYEQQKKKSFWERIFSGDNQC